MSIGDKVCVSHNGMVLYGVVNHEFMDLGKIVYLPIIKESKLFQAHKIVEWVELDWITQIKLLEQAKEIDFND